MLDDLQISVRQKKSHEIRFVNIVVTLSYFEVDWKYFKETLRYISQEELFDIVDERNGNNKCGYPICIKTYKAHPTATVSLNIPDKRIYDISRRKKFCSDWCYAAYKFIEDQLPEDKTWKIGVSKSIAFKEYPKNGEGCRGEVCYDEDIKSISQDETACDENSTSSTKDVGLKSKENVVEKIMTNNLSYKNENEISKNEKTLKKVHFKENTDPSVTADRIDRIQGIIKSLDDIALKKAKELPEVLEKVRESTTKRAGRKLIFIDDVPLTERTAKPIPEDVDHLDKVVESVSEWITNATRHYFGQEEEEVIEYGEVCNEGDEIHIMPPMDSCDQVVIRRSIILRRIQSCATPILAEFGVEENSFHIELIKFMKTCRLSSRNILFSARELRCLVVVLIDILLPKLSQKITVQKSDLLTKYALSSEQCYQEALEVLTKLLAEDSVGEEPSISVTSHGDV